MGFSIYFGAKKDTEGKVHLAVIVYEGMTSFPPIEEKIDDMPDATFYEHETAAMLLALEIIEDEGYDDVTLYNQNKLVFEWIQKFNHENELRDMYYKEVRKRMATLVEDETDIQYKVIKGKQNEAKRYLQKKQPKKKGNEGVVDLTSMFKKNLNKKHVINKHD